MNKYNVTIGIEVHVELNTKSKVFSPSPNQFGAEVNTLINEIDLGMPGVLPNLNKEVIDMGIKCAIALNANINQTMHFDRKNYFYADNPKNFQITQAETPIGYNGYLAVNNQKIGIERLHIEEDTAKSIHDSSKTYLDFNRAGVPLIEIVTKPEIHDAETAALYIEKLRETLLYLGISDVKMEEGSMRCDVNISLSDSDILGTKVEIKNIGSIKYAKKAIELEIARQEKMLENGEKIIEQTMRYDDTTGNNNLMRVKETGNDYRYFPEPDIPVINISDDWISAVKEQMPLMPDQIRTKLVQCGVNDNNIKALLRDKDLLSYVLNYFEDFDNIVILVNLLISEFKAYMNELNKDISQLIKHEDLVNLVKDLDSKKITSQDAKLIINNIINSNDNYLLVLNQLLETKPKVDVDQLITIIINNNPSSVADYKAGKDRAIKYLMGQLMKETKGAINPQIANQKLLEALEKLF